MYNGEFAPAEQYAPQLQELRQNYLEHLKHYYAFGEKLIELSPRLRGEFERILEETVEMYPLGTADAFIDGFRLGARLMIEVLRAE